MYAARWLRSVYVCNRHLTTQTQQAAKEKRQRRRSAALTASSLSFLRCDNMFNAGEKGGGIVYHFHVEREMDEQTVECMDEKCNGCRFMLAFIFCMKKESVR